MPIIDTPRTALILVGGAPGAGKTTLARRLAKEIDVPLISRDDLKETLFETLGVPDRAASRALGVASFAIFFHVLDALVGKVPGVIAECNFTRGRSEAELRPLVPRSRVMLLHCTTSRAVIAQRISARLTDRNRHPGHHDVENLPQVLEQIDAGVYDPLDLSLPILTVDTTDGYAPTLQDIVTFVFYPRPDTD